MIRAKFNAEYNLFIAVKQQKNGFLSIIQSKNDIMAEYAIIDSVVVNLDKLFTTSTHTTAGVTDQKDFLYESLIKAAFPLIGIVKRYALKQHDLIAAAKFNSTEAKLLNGNQTAGRNICTEVIAYATTHLTDLAASDVTQTLLTALTASVAAFDAAKKPKVAQGEHASSIQQIKAEIKRGKAAIAALKDLTLRLKATNPDYYNGFLTATKPTNPASASIGAVAGILRADSKRKRIAGATVTVFHLKTDGSLHQIEVLTTNSSGEFHTSLQAGSYQFVVDAPNYAPITQDKLVRNGNNKLAITLDLQTA